MNGLAMFEIKDDYEPLPAPEQLRKRAAEAHMRQQIRRTIEAVEQFGMACNVAAVGIERSMADFKEALARLAQRREKPMVDPAWIFPFLQRRNRGRYRFRARGRQALRNFS